MLRDEFDRAIGSCIYYETLRPETGVIVTNPNIVIKPPTLNDKIRNVIFNPPATIVFWSDGTKTIAKCEPCDKFDKEKGLMMAILKKEHKASHIIDVFDKYIYTKEDCENND